MIKITDVAREAGVSPSTVSHVLNGNRPISKKTRERVLKVIERLGYQPNTNASALKSKYSGIIGFFASDITELFVTRIIRGVEKVTGPRNQFLLFASGVEFGYDLNKALTFLKRRNIDGIIVSYGISRSNEKEDLKNLDLPIVTINRDISESTTCVLPDNFAGGYAAAGHLISRGATKLAMIAGPKDRYASKERMEGFIQGVTESRNNCSISGIMYGSFDFKSGYEGMEALLRKEPLIDGVFCANDYMAAGAIDCARRKGIRIPEEIKVAGFDDREFAAFWPTPITTFAQPLESMGEKSAELLLKLIHEEEIPDNKIFLKSTLIERKSTAG